MACKASRLGRTACGRYEPLNIIYWRVQPSASAAQSRALYPRLVHARRVGGGGGAVASHLAHQRGRRTQQPLQPQADVQRKAIFTTGEIDSGLTFNPSEPRIETRPVDEELVRGRLCIAGVVEEQLEGVQQRRAVPREFELSERWMDRQPCAILVGYQPE